MSDKDEQAKRARLAELEKQSDDMMRKIWNAHEARFGPDKHYFYGRPEERPALAIHFTTDGGWQVKK